jgi:hypothetical protein
VAASLGGLKLPSPDIIWLDNPKRMKHFPGGYYHEL